MKDWAIEIINNYGYWGVLLLTFLESIFPIVPAEIILTLCGFMTTYTDMTRIGVIISATTGELFGALTLYSVGRFFPIEKLERITTWRISKMLGIKIVDLYNTRDWFIKKGKYSVLFGRCIPVFGSLISIPAGMAQMNLITFILFTLLGITVWNSVLVMLGVAAETSWEIIAHGADTFSTILAYLFLLFVLINVILLYNKHHKSKTV